MAKLKLVHRCWICGKPLFDRWLTVNVETDTNNKQKVLLCGDGSSCLNDLMLLVNICIGTIQSYSVEVCGPSMQWSKQMA